MTSWKNRVFINPGLVMKLEKTGCTIPMHILNNSPQRLAFKLKSTRNISLKPSVTNGFLSANGGCSHVFFAFKPQSNEKPLNANDRISNLMTTAPEGVMNWASCTGGKGEQGCVRFVIKLRQLGEPDSEESEESETETDD